MNTLPDEILRLILDKMPDGQLIKFGAVSIKLQSIYQNEQFWKDRWELFFGPGENKYTDLSWKNRYYKYGFNNSKFIPLKMGDKFGCTTLGLRIHKGDSVASILGGLFPPSDKIYGRVVSSNIVNIIFNHFGDKIEFMCVALYALTNDLELLGVVSRSTHSKLWSDYALNDLDCISEIYVNKLQ